eukprot:TRINITY_DN5997_c0_g1_i1.p1 TRINITY_DN5997_c0_g1~~TRINITY_DN5997_c0_g1_i1.p1  ORF type:complete len:521 (+),score=72.95 TRINITY_DN5997_c0_g1_i1:51-1613(+)
MPPKKAQGHSHGGKVCSHNHSHSQQRTGPDGIPEPTWGNLLYMIIMSKSMQVMYFTCFLYWFLMSSLTTTIPSHMTHKPVLQIPDLLSESDAEMLLEDLRERKDVPSNTEDLNFYETTHEHIGEAVPLVDGKCAHHYLVPNKNRTKCILPGRIDIGRHYTLTGGITARKEPFSKLVSRVKSFGIYNFHIQDHPVLKKLFKKPNFADAAKKICPAKKQHLDPFQFNYIVQLPGQTVATHIDGVYFNRATRLDIPQWLLAAMKFSGYFEDEFVPQVQVVGYIHQWEDHERMGEFVVWNPEPESYEPTRLTGLAVDGSQVVHAASDYCPGQEAPVIDKDSKSRLQYIGDDMWALRVNETVLRMYRTNDLRISVVYRARCFEDEDAKVKFNTESKDKINRWSLDFILDRFRQGLVQKGELSQEAVDTISSMTLALAILRTYIAYPMPDAMLPLNVCFIPDFYPYLPFGMCLLMEFMTFFMMRSLLNNKSRLPPWAGSIYRSIDVLRAFFRLIFVFTFSLYWVCV